MNFCACLYWCRSSKKDLDTLRFYYAMGLSAVVGETTMGTLGASCCKSQSVGEDSKRMKALRGLVGVKSLREIAMTDAVSTVRQVQKLRPVWFMRGVSKRTRRGVQKLGVEQDQNSRFEIKHESVAKAGLPQQISEEIFHSNALIAEIWRMACDKVISDSTQYPKVEAVHKFEELWLLAEEVCDQETPGCKISDKIRTYHALCKQYLGTIEVQARRLANLTVTRPLKRSRNCLISAPRWNPVKMRKKWSFSCKSQPPKISGVTIPCFICGCESHKNTLVANGINPEDISIRICNDCGRLAHKECITKQNLRKPHFCCKYVKRYLGQNATELEISEPVKPKPLREDMKCLICGDECSRSHLDRLDCSETGCNYGAHESCAAILCQINGDLLNASEFKCNDVNYYLKPTEIVGLATSDPIKFAAIRIILKSRGSIRHSSYSPTRIRYENPDIECHRCNEPININELDHELAYCSARYAGTPVPARDYEYVMSRAKRIRRFALNDYPP